MKTKRLKRLKRMSILVQQQVVEALKESQGVLRDLYAGRSVAGRVLDCIDSNHAALQQAAREMS